MVWIWKRSIWFVLDVIMNIVLVHRYRTINVHIICLRWTFAIFTHYVSELTYEQLLDEDLQYVYLHICRVPWYRTASRRNYMYECGDNRSNVEVVWINEAINISKFRSGDTVLRGTTKCRGNEKTKLRWAVNIFCLYLFARRDKPSVYQLG